LPSTAEVVRDGETALLYPPSDVPALTEALRRLRDDAALRQRLGAAAQAEVMAHYTWAARARMILDCIRSADAPLHVPTNTGRM
jgi:glycosyltransferase involved in cell wall biosynthesis